MDDQIDGLLKKAESAFDADQVQQGYGYLNLAATTAYLREREAKAIEKMTKAGTSGVRDS